jgi:hypothetical protein
MSDVLRDHPKQPDWCRYVNETSAGADGYVAATMSRWPKRRMRPRRAFLTEQDCERAAQTEAEAWLRGYVFGRVYGCRNRWWWQRIRSRDVPPAFSRLEFVMAGVGKAGSPITRLRSRLARI